MRKIVYQCDRCREEVVKLVVFEATNLNLWERPLYCKKCAVEEFSTWIESKLFNENTVLVINPSISNLPEGK